MSGKVALAINVTEVGEAGSGNWVAVVPQFAIQVDGDSAIAAAAKAVAQLKKHAMSAVDDELSAQESLPIKEKPAKKKLKAVEQPTADDLVEAGEETES